jgi:phosphinothricin acetyltransferase
VSPADRTVTVRDLVEADWPDVQRIYAQGITGGNATFEASTPTWDQFDASRLPGHRLVAVDQGDEVLGWAAASAVSAREVYAGVVGHSVYVDDRSRGRGVGQTLLQALIRSTEEAGIWTIQTSIFPENTASLTLHKSAGFRTIGTRERIARMVSGPYAGQWRDTVFLERRSQIP